MWVLNKIKVPRSEHKLATVLPINSNPTAFYSKKSNTSVESVVKSLNSKVGLEDGEQILVGEGGPNWELLGPKGSRFIFPNLVGLAWQEPSTTAPLGTPIKNLVDFEKKEKDKLQLKIAACPTLIKQNLHEMFPAYEVLASEKMTLITLRHIASKEYEQETKNARKFVIAARAICSRLQVLGFWADFMNPFSGKAFYSYISGLNIKKSDDQFRGIGIKLEQKKNCVVISPDDENVFSGSIFTDAPTDSELLKSLLRS